MSDPLAGPFSLLVPLLMALSSLLHCLGMCGGIVGAISWHRTAGAASGWGDPWLFPLTANLGRLVSYSLAGGLVAASGRALFDALSPVYGHAVLQGLSSVILLGNGLFLLGRFPEMRLLERVGMPLWRLVEPVARRLMTPNSLAGAFLFGLVWGWFPCSLVYGALLWSSASCSALSGAAVMFLFGLGTLPVMLSAGWLTGWLSRWCGGASRFGHGVAILLIALGVFNLIFLGWNVHTDHAHAIHNHQLNCLIPP